MNRHWTLSQLVLLLTLACSFFPSQAARPQIEEEDGAISIASFNQLIKVSPEQIHWIDVRDHEEVAQDGTFATAQVIPMEDFEAQIPKLPADKPIIFFCNTGTRAGEAYDFVKMKRSALQVYFLDANLNFNKQALPIVSSSD
jgi:rhodanese-related sulfurtransferase